jgi:putative FmdB family regulatory protein
LIGVVFERKASMPIYEYRCRKCGEILEVIQKLSDRPKRKCPSCSGRLEKLVSRTSFMLKGGGWYAEGYSAGKKTGGSGSSGSSGSGSSDSSSDSSTTKKAATA